MRAPFDDLARRGAAGVLGALAGLVGAGFLTSVGYRALAVQYDAMIAGLVFGLGYIALGAGLWVFAARSTVTKEPGHPASEPGITDVLAVFVDGLEKGKRARRS
ncbi:MAG: hypothetical protein AAGF78_11095 [Pseudomonadota bacterium]